MDSEVVKNPLLRTYFFYTGVLVLKMMVMPLLTIRQRFANNAFGTQEDAKFLRGTMSRTNEKVERVRRGHLNDIENIYLFLLISFVYIWTNPDPQWTNCLFSIFTICRFVHTFVYTVVVVPQPARGLSWAIGFLITGYMALRAILYFH